MIALLLALNLTEPTTSWMEGYWLSCEGGREVSETWSDLRGRVMAGTTVTLEHGIATVERATIDRRGDRFLFVAQPDGQPPTSFALSDYSEGYGDVEYEHQVVFSNPDHDYPQRIIYTRKGDVLTARIEGRSNGRTEAMSWRYLKADLNARCPAS